MAFDWRKRQAEMRAVIREAVSPEDLSEIVEMVIARATRGDGEAKAFVQSYGGDEALRLRVERYVRSEG
jgi:hypothetical protein